MCWQCWEPIDCTTPYIFDYPNLDNLVLSSCVCLACMHVIHKLRAGAICMEIRITTGLWMIFDGFCGA